MTYQEHFKSALENALVSKRVLENQGCDFSFHCRDQVNYYMGKFNKIKCETRKQKWKAIADAWLEASKN